MGAQGALRANLASREAYPLIRAITVEESHPTPDILMNCGGRQKVFHQYVEFRRNLTRQTSAQFNTNGRHSISEAYEI